MTVKKVLAACVLLCCVAFGAMAAGSGLTGSFEVQLFIGGYGDTWWKEMVAGFQKENPNLKMTVNMGPNVNNQMQSRWLSDDPPDFAFADGAGFAAGQFMEDGKLLDLTDYFNTAKTQDGKSLIKDNLAGGMLVKWKDGKLYTAPFVFGSLGMFYDAKLLRDLKLKVPTSFTEFLKLAPALKAKGIALMDYPGIYPVYLYLGLIQPLYAIEGSQQFFDDIEAMKPGTFTSPLFVKGFKKLEALAKTDNGVMQGTVALNHTQSQMEFLNHKAAFIPNGLWIENEMKKDVPDGFEMTFIPSLIQEPGQKYGICPYSAGNVIAANAKNPGAAKAFLSFIYRPANMARFTETTGTPTAYKVDLGKSTASPFAKSAVKWLSDKNVVAVTGKSPGAATGQVMNDCINSIVMGKMSAEEACAQIEAAAQKEAAELAAKK
jgi:N-acetylglucosamine transport system substrate-binding protein